MNIERLIVEKIANHACPTGEIGDCFWCQQILWSRYGVRYKDKDGKPVQHFHDCPYQMARELTLAEQP